MGGPVVQIRYFFVPATNALFTGPTPFHPAAEDLDGARNTDGVGEITTSPRKWDDGNNRYPELDGRSLIGTGADFAGETSWNQLSPPSAFDYAPPGGRLRCKVSTAMHQSGVPAVECQLRFSVASTCSFVDPGDE